jgi:hypothetical protein
MSWKWVVIGGAGVLVAGLGVAFLFLAWIAPILLLTRDAPTTTPLAVSPPPSAPALSTASVQPAPAFVDPRFSSASVGPAQMLHPMTRGIRRAMRATLSNGLGAGLSDLKPQLEKCPDQHIHRGGEGSESQDVAKMMEIVQRQIAAGEDKDGATQDLAKVMEIVQRQIAAGEDQKGATPLPKIMMLEVETSNSQVKILDADLATPGSATDAFMACARQVLRGQIITVPAAPPGAHLRIPVDLDGAQIGDQLESRGRRRRR